MVSYWKLAIIKKALKARKENELNKFTPDDVLRWLKDLGYHHTFSQTTITRYIQGLDEYECYKEYGQHTQTVFSFRGAI